MDYNKIIKELQRNSSVFENLLGNIKKEDYLFKTNPDKWCLLEILCHLYDEEREDFRARVKHTLETPDKPLPPIDPVGWVESRKYISADYNDTLNKFLNEREQSVAWLQSLSNPKWENYYTHPKFGKMSARMFLSNWLAHDYLHFRQIIKVKYEILDNLSSEVLNYAGNW